MRPWQIVLVVIVCILVIVGIVLAFIFASKPSQVAQCSQTGVLQEPGCIYHACYLDGKLNFHYTNATAEQSAGFLYSVTNSSTNEVADAGVFPQQPAGTTMFSTNINTSKMTKGDNYAIHIQGVPDVCTVFPGGISFGIVY